ncbi:MAG: magnesium transporter CorA family protein [Chloroflexi bacterium]|nr:magnesium transporter CorA family protein [Chloroflexota bacterium]
MPRPVRLRSTRAPAQQPVSPVARRDEIEGEGLRWIHIPRPASADGEWLQATFGFHALDLEDVFSRNQRPKLDRYDDYLFLVMQFPVYEKTRQRMVSVELDLFVGQGYLVTLPSAELPPLEALFERVTDREELRTQLFSKGAGYVLYRVVDACVDASFPMLRKMGLKLDQLEDDILEEQRTAEIVRDINDLKQEIITFRRIVRPQRAVLGDLEKTKQRYLAEDMEIYFDDISDAAERIWDILENHKEVIESLEATNESVLSHRLNDAIKVLNAVTVLMLPATLIASIYGMNVLLPVVGGDPDDPANFWILSLIMLATIVGTLGFLRRRGWL